MVDLTVILNYNKSMERHLPIGIQDFVKIREGGYNYVDKSAQIHRLINSSGSAFFLSRPRRFGKSLLCSTLEAIFEGKRKLFTNLAIHSLDWEWKKYPVILIDLNPGNYSNGVNELYVNLNRDLELCAKKYDVPFSGETVSDRFVRLIYTLHERCNERVVVIIDEYDKPLINTIENSDLHVSVRNELKGFYGVLKSSDKYLKFVFLTGVTKFSQVSVFSDLNHLIDLTLDVRYADICGITQEELESNFESEINKILEDTGKNRAGYMERLRSFYNGYRFSKKTLSVYNPFGLLNHFDKGGDFFPYWYQTGTPAFLVKLVVSQKINIINLNNLRVGYNDFAKYDIEKIRAVPLLYQCGYLTIADYNEELNHFILDYPNEEVRSCFAKSLLEQYTQVSAGISDNLYSQLLFALFTGDIACAIDNLQIFFSSIPYDIIKETENYYQTAVHLIFTMIGLDCRSEVRISSGRIDTLVETKNYVYCFEFKLNKTVEEALKQIDKRNYLLPWKNSGKKLFKVGVNFDHEKRNIGEWQAEEAFC